MSSVLPSRPPAASARPGGSRPLEVDLRLPLQRVVIGQRFQRHLPRTLVVFGIWWAFWGVGIRLLVAGISQLVNPGRTAQGILGGKDAGAELVVHELG